MPRQFIDLSITLCNDVVSDPPFMRPHIAYQTHGETVTEAAHFFPGLTAERLAENRSWLTPRALDPATGHVERRVHTGAGAHQLFLSPDKKILWVNNRVAGTTVALDSQTLDLLRTYKVPGGPDDIDFAPDGKLWITQRWAKRVAVMDPASGALREIDVGRSPHGIFLTTHMR